MKSLDYSRYFYKTQPWYYNVENKKNTKFSLWKAAKHLIRQLFNLRLHTQNGIWMRFLALKFHKPYACIPQRFFFKSLQCTNKAIFITYWICNFEFLWSKKNNVAHELYKINFSIRPFTIIFRPKIVILDTYSILVDKQRLNQWRIMC